MQKDISLRAGKEREEKKTGWRKPKKLGTKTKLQRHGDQYPNVMDVDTR